MKTKTVEVIYKFKIKYEHPDHLKDMVKELQDNVDYIVGGAGLIDGEVYYYNCGRTGKGRVIK